MHGKVIYLFFKQDNKEKEEKPYKIWQIVHIQTIYYTNNNHEICKNSNLYRKIVNIGEWEHFIYFTWSSGNNNTFQFEFQNLYREKGLLRVKRCHTSYHRMRQCVIQVPRAKNINSNSNIIRRKDATFRLEETEDNRKKLY